MPKLKRKSQVRRVGKKGDVVDFGTPETRDKLRRSVTLRLLRQGRISQQDYVATQQIEHAVQTLSSVACPLGKDDAGSGGSLKPRIVGHLTDRQRQDVNKFLRWQDTVLEEMGIEVLAALMEVITDNLGINKAEKRYRLGQRKGVKLFRTALEYWT